MPSFKEAIKKSFWCASYAVLGLTAMLLAAFGMSILATALGVM